MRVRIKYRIGLILLGILLLCTETIHAQGWGNEASRLETEGKAAMERADYDQAIAIFSSAPFEEFDETTSSAFNFYLGLSYQSANKLAEAENHYLEVLKVRPEASSVHFNLAQIYAKTNRDRLCYPSYERAISIAEKNNDREKQSFYSLNYAEYLEKNSDYSKAIEYYRVAQKATPHDERAHIGLIEAYESQKDSGALLDYVERLIDSGEPMLGTETALRALQSELWDSRGKRQVAVDLLSLAVLGLAKRGLPPSKFADSKYEVMLVDLETHTFISPGVISILEVYNKFPEADGKLELKNNPNDKFYWWVEQGDHGIRSRKARPLDAFWNLLHVVGDWYLANGEMKVAESYYRRSLNMTDLATGELNQEAILRLAWLYDKKGDFEEFELFLEKGLVEENLFDGKVMAIRKKNWPKQYKYHRTLGTVYYLMKKWGSSRQVTSAIFQLERALVAAEHFENQEVDPKLAKYLLEAYDASDQGQTRKAKQLRSRID